REIPRFLGMTHLSSEVGNKLSEQIPEEPQSLAVALVAVLGGNSANEAPCLLPSISNLDPSQGSG
ncbi:MAG: hypothetical protein ACPGWR_24525, partial [Ardenticatenaceae bacterium]